MTEQEPWTDTSCQRMHRPEAPRIISLGRETDRFTNLKKKKKGGGEVGGDIKTVFNEEKARLLCYVEPGVI